MNTQITILKAKGSSLKSNSTSTLINTINVSAEILEEKMTGKEVSDDDLIFWDVKVLQENTAGLIGYGYISWLCLSKNHKSKRGLWQNSSFNNEFGSTYYVCLGQIELSFNKDGEITMGDTSNKWHHPETSEIIRECVGTLIQQSKNASSAQPSVK